MGRIKDLIIEATNAGYNIEKLDLVEMQQIKEHGYLLDPQRELDCKLPDEDDLLIAEAEQAHHLSLLYSGGPRVHGW